ncbi:MAG: hypothetical protein Q4G69_09805, partial [Planctomycetia bacterium]|nr:hypothetical protein [Planctomycetia bacterium]
KRMITVPVDAVPVKSATAPMVVESLPVKKDNPPSPLPQSNLPKSNKKDGSPIQIPMLSTEVGSTEMIAPRKARVAADPVVREDGSHRPHGTELLGVEPGITKMN